MNGWAYWLVVSLLVLINDIAVHRAQLQLGWVNVC